MNARFFGWLGGAPRLRRGTGSAWSVLALGLLVACAGARADKVDGVEPKEPKAADEKAPMDPEKEKRMQVATLAAGCFWCVEAVYLRIKGIEKVESGYIGGHVKNPTYREVCEGTTGHAEAVRVWFDPEVVTFEKLLRVFFELHDPTTLNRQGPDVGTQYRSAIFYHDDEQKAVAERVKKEVGESGRHADPIVTEITKADTWYVAEDYHQDFFNRNPDNRYCQVMIPPKLKKLGLELK